ncbi:MAG: prephenate dehydrogenase [Candidatus Doudnabacteria bacterium]|nr:prephenate dehydrogenase [Candidatus Doudnabacteria bacterium]
MKNIAIIGYGRFGELLSRLLSTNYTIYVVENDSTNAEAAKNEGYDVIELADIRQCDTVIFAVPISAIEQVVKEAANYINEGHLVMDICSVKVHPANVMRRHLPDTQIIATHPMFGPDSASNGFAGLQVAICPITANDDFVQEVDAAWKKLGVETLLTTPEQHDKDAVLSQSFTYSLAKLILNMNIPEVTLTTRSFNALREVARLSANDSEQLFHDMLYYNPYFAQMKQELQRSIDATLDVLGQIEREQEASKIFKDSGL